MNKPVTPAAGDSADSANVLQIRKIGNSLGLILPKDVIAKLRLGEGDRLDLVEQPDGGLKLSRHEETHARALEFARRAFKDYANTFRELAK